MPGRSMDGDLLGWIDWIDNNNNGVVRGLAEGKRWKLIVVNLRDDGDDSAGK